MVKKLLYKFLPFKDVRLVNKDFRKEDLALLDESSLRKMWLRNLRNLLVTGVFLVFVGIGLFWIGRLEKPSYFEDTSSKYEAYKKEEEILGKSLDVLYGKDNWEMGIYQTKLDAFRVIVKKDGKSVERYYRVIGGEVYEVQF
jgi:hypothetical protein